MSADYIYNTTTTTCGARDPIGPAKGSVSSAYRRASTYIIEGFPSTRNFRISVIRLMSRF